MTQTPTPPPDWTPAEPSQPAAPAPPAAAPPPAQAAKPTATRADKIRLGLILGGIVAFLAVVLYMTRDNQAADDLAAGQCFDIPDDADFSTVTRHECTEAHDAEVFHVAEYSGDAYPISLSLESFIDEQCVPVFQTYTGTAFADQEALAIGYIYPTRDAWDSGDRTVTCYALNDDESKLTQSVKAGA